MAERRMFTKKVTDDDNFIELSASAQALYLQLSMSADDDGFCNQVTASMFKAHASIQDLESLLAKRYLYQFENGVIVIKHWRMANALRKDRYTPTVFQEEMKRLNIKENGAYTLDSSQGKPLLATNWQPTGNQLATQNRLGKDSLVKEKYNVCFEEFWKTYPRKKEKAKTYKCYQARLNDGYSEDELLEACKNYASDCENTQREEKYIKLGSTFLSSTTPFVDYLNKNFVPEKKTKKQPYASNSQRKYDFDALMKEFSS